MNLTSTDLLIGGGIAAAIVVIGLALWILGRGQ
jgi:hypothetical protein